MRIDVTVTKSVAPNSSATVHEIGIDLSGVSSAPAFFDVLASQMELPDYFGRNWAALDECLSDYFVIESGGLGSEFGDRHGVDARIVRVVVRHAGDAVVAGLLTRFLDVLDYVREVDEHRRTADLEVVLQADDRAEAVQLERELARRSCR